MNARGTRCVGHVDPLARQPFFNGYSYEIRCRRYYCYPTITNQDRIWLPLVGGQRRAPTDPCFYVDVFLPSSLYVKYLRLCRPVSWHRGPAPDNSIWVYDAMTLMNGLGSLPIGRPRTWYGRQTPLRRLESESCPYIACQVLHRLKYVCTYENSGRTKGG